MKNMIRIGALFLIGFVMNLIRSKFSFETGKTYCNLVRVLGILQRLSICYAALLVYHLVTGYGVITRRKIGAVFMFLIFVVYFILYITFDGGDVEGCSK
jgi:predicted acyltransferase